MTREYLQRTRLAAIRIGSLLLLWMHGGKTSAQLFDSAEPLQLVFRGNTQALLRDRSDSRKWHAFRMQIGSDTTTYPVQLKTRGNFRRDRANCVNPPLMLNLRKGKTMKGTPFAGQDKLKIVMPCRDPEYVDREYQVYQLYNLVTPISLRARKISIRLDDNTGQKPVGPLPAFIIEDPAELAKRQGMTLMPPGQRNPADADTLQYLRMALFQFMIGNTDWGARFGHNMHWLRPSGGKPLIPLPYDFDFSGLVNTNYSAPAPELDLPSVTDRRYRGYCVSNLSVFDPVIAEFTAKKDAILAPYSASSAFSERYRRFATGFLQDFYSILQNERQRRNFLTYPCDPRGTGNVEIKGLNNN